MTDDYRDYDQEKLRKRHAKLDLQIQTHRQIEAGRRDRQARASAIARTLRDIADMIESCGADFGRS